MGRGRTGGRGRGRTGGRGRGRTGGGGEGGQGEGEREDRGRGRGRTGGGGEGGQGEGRGRGRKREGLLNGETSRSLRSMHLRLPPFSLKPSFKRKNNTRPISYSYLLNIFKWL